MPKIAANVLEAVGNTPLVRLNRVTAGISATVCAKLEASNPGRSVKDRIGLAVVEDAERRGLLKPGGTIVEPTSGNMGVALAIVAAVKGYKCIFTIPDKMSIEKIRRLRAFGAEVVVTPTAVPPESSQSYYSVARRLADGRLKVVNVPELNEMGIKSVIAYDGRTPLSSIAQEFLTLLRERATRVQKLRNPLTSSPSRNGRERKLRKRQRVCR